MRDVHGITPCIENRLNRITLVRKLKKLESFQLTKPSDFRDLELFAQSIQSTKFSRFAKTEVGRTDNGKKIQQINKFRVEGNSESPSFVTLYQPPFM
jgi:hypothetical protein